MAQKLLNVAQVRATVEQMSGKGVTQGVRADIVHPGADANVFLHHPANRACCNSRALVVEKYSLWLALGHPRVVEKSITGAQIDLQRFARRIAERNDAFLTPFAGHANQFVLEVHVGQIHFRKFRDAHTRRVHQFQDGSIALAQVRVRVRRLDELDGFLN